MAKKKKQSFSLGTVLGGLAALLGVGYFFFNKREDEFDQKILAAEQRLIDSQNKSEAERQAAQEEYDRLIAEAERRNQAELDEAERRNQAELDEAERRRLADIENQRNKTVNEVLNDQDQFNAIGQPTVANGFVSYTYRGVEFQHSIPTIQSISKLVPFGVDMGEPTQHVISSQPNGFYKISAGQDSVVFTIV